MSAIRCFVLSSACHYFVATEDGCVISGGRSAYRVDLNRASLLAGKQHYFAYWRATGGFVVVRFGRGHVRVCKKTVFF